MEYDDGDASETLKLITAGRRTGLPHIVRLRYAREGRRVYLLCGSGESDWVLNSLASGVVRLRLGGRVVRARVGEPGTDRDRALSLFRAKYGNGLVSRWYEGPGESLTLSILDGSVGKAAGGENEALTTFEEWRSLRYDYYSSVASAFDSASEEYDFTIDHNYINAWIRAKSISSLLSIAGHGDALLEIGCGTGAEAVKISGHVRKIIATDISESMIDILKLKIRARNLQGKIIPFRLAASEISRLEGAIGAEEIRVAYSFNGALNCEPRLAAFVEHLDRLLAPRGYFLCSIRNAVCASEMVAHLSAFRPGKGVPRRKQPMMVSVGGRDIPALYYTPMSFAEKFRERFRLLKLTAIPAFLPPAYLSDYYVRSKPVGSILERLEALLADKAPFNRLGDQSLLVLQKKR
ncbi:MAG: methyltransferase domain-containing protein [Nitrososphaerota archaeon]|nr:methyltransferase domain-containing protein [Nitrososphaerota archaeon]